MLSQGPDLTPLLKGRTELGSCKERLDVRKQTGRNVTSIVSGAWKHIRHTSLVFRAAIYSVSWFSPHLIVLGICLEFSNVR